MKKHFFTVKSSCQLIARPETLRRLRSSHKFLIALFCLSSKWISFSLFLNFGLGQKMQAETRIKPWSGGISKLSGKLSKSYPQATGSTQECGASTLIVLFSRSPSCKIKFPFTHLWIPWRAWCNIFKCNSRPHIKVTESLKEEASMVR